MHKEETRISFSLKDFKNREENFVREEFLVPIFKAAGYDAFGSELIARGVNLSKNANFIKYKTDGRNYIYPDFVLYSNDTPLWIVDAKSPKVKINSKKNIEQILSYSYRLACSNLILSNAIDTYIYEIRNSKLHELFHFTLDEIRINKWEKILNILSPENTIKKTLSFEEAINLYGTDDYIDRSALMKILQIYSFEEIKCFLTNSNNNSLYNSLHLRNRALPAILIAPNASKDTKLFQDIIMFSITDSDSVVRENLFTCLISNIETIKEDNLIKEIYSIEPKTFLEELLFLTLLKNTVKGRQIIKKYKSSNRIISEYLKGLKNINTVSFPLALLIKKSKNIGYKEYYTYIKLLPLIIEGIEKCSNTHYETLTVLNHCLSYAKKMNESIYNILLQNTSRYQKNIIDKFSDKLY